MCAFEWNPEELANEEAINVKDANGTLLSDGDKVTVIKDLKIKGSYQSNCLFFHLKKNTVTNALNESQ